MKLLISTDEHYSINSSIVRSRGEKYSARLENEISSLSWVDRTAEENHCDAIWHLGDFFDKNEMQSEEIVALREIKWAETIPHYFLVGNHEISRGNLEFSTAHLFQLCSNMKVIDVPTSFMVGETEICALPYVSKTVSKDDISEFFPDRNINAKRRIVFSHNDLRVQFGNWLSPDGFEPNNIESFCDLFVNGHIHTGETITNKIINLGNLTGANFSEDAFKSSHRVMLLDTDTLEIKYIENPYAFNFYKFDVESVEEFQTKLNVMKNNAVISVKCPEDCHEEIKTIIANSDKVVESRITIDYAKDRSKVSEEDMDDICSLAKVDHLESFRRYILQSFGDSDMVQSELQKILQ